MRIEIPEGQDMVMHIVTEWQRTETSVPHVVPVVVHHGMRKLLVELMRWTPEKHDTDG